MKLPIAVMAVGLGLSVASCSAPEAQSAPPTAVAVSATTLTPMALFNARYQIPDYGTIKMTNGSYEQDDPESGDRWSAGVTDTFVPADLNHNHIEDVATLLWVNSGESQHVTYLAIVEADQSVKNLSTVMLGDRVQVKSVTAQAGKLTVDLLIPAPNDPPCCPSLEVQKIYMLRGTTLEQVAQKTIGRVRSENAP